jgi:L-aspartate oxidase
VGSGVAGSAAALIAAQVYKIPVTLLFAGDSPSNCNSYWAQGGIIYRNFDASSGDSAEALSRDIHTAGAGLCQHDAVVKVATEGPSIVEQLLLDDSGIFAHVPFDRDQVTGDLSLCLEASHSAPRILFYKDATGRAITEEITKACLRHPHITLQANTVVTDLIVKDDTCIGVETLVGSDDDTQQQQVEYASHGVVLCAGGLAGIYQHSTNPAGFNALGSSVALSERASVKTQELEFVQFHPTSLNIPNEARFLLTEALRGEGGILRNKHGEAFMKEHHPMAELAPRDIVARGVFQEAQESGSVFLDITHRSQDFLYQRFPTIQTYLSERGLDLAKDWLPVIPAAHYTCGGVSTDLKGRTSLQNLYAAGEAARTGLHGGNRLASTSLLEGLVFGAAVANQVGTSQNDSARGIIAASYNVNGTLRTVSTASLKERDAVKQEAIELLRLVRKCMWDNVGVIRTVFGLETALNELQVLGDEASDLFEKAATRETAGVRDAIKAGTAVARAALQNRASVGAHCIISDDDSEDEDEIVAAGGMH